MMGSVNPFRKVTLGLGAFAMVLVVGTAGYLAFGFDLTDAVYQTVSTVTTVGFATPRPLDTAAKVFTIVLILGGVGTALYTFSAVLEVLIEGHMRELVRRRRVEREIDRLDRHVIVCGWGRVGREVARFLETAGFPVVVIDRDPTRAAEIPHLSVCGDATDDDVLREAGIARAATLVAALDTDADNVYLSVAGKSIRPDLQIIARARNKASEAKLVRAGADRVVNPQQLGGDRMAAFVTQPHVVDFIDVVMHDGSLKFRLEEQPVGETSPIAGQTLGDTQLHDRTGALVLAVRRENGQFVTNPSASTPIGAGDVLISVGSEEQLAALASVASPPGR